MRSQLGSIQVLTRFSESTEFYETNLTNLGNSRTDGIIVRGWARAELGITCSTVRGWARVTLSITHSTCRFIPMDLSVRGQYGFFPRLGVDSIPPIFLYMIWYTSSKKTRKSPFLLPAPFPSGLALTPYHAQAWATVWSLSHGPLPAMGLYVAPIGGDKRELGVTEPEIRPSRCLCQSIQNLLVTNNLNKKGVEKRRHTCRTLHTNLEPTWLVSEKEACRLKGPLKYSLSNDFPTFHEPKPGAMAQAIA